MTDRTYKIGEVAEILNLKSYVLRFWETEFPQVEPARTEKGQRLYSEADVALLKRIKFLLREQGMTIEGARRILSADGDAPADLPDPPQPPRPMPSKNQPASSPAGQPSAPPLDAGFIKKELLALRGMLTGVIKK